MICNRCGNPEARHVRIKYVEGKRYECCEKCGELQSYVPPDAWCPEGGYFDENLADEKHRKGQFVHSKQHKADLLNKLGLREAGSDPNPVTGKVTPYFKDAEKRRRYCIENFGERG